MELNIKHTYTSIEIFLENHTEYKTSQTRMFFFFFSSSKPFYFFLFYFFCLKQYVLATFFFWSYPYLFNELQLRDVLECFRLLECSDNILKWSWKHKWFCKCSTQQKFTCQVDMHLICRQVMTRDKIILWTQHVSWLTAEWAPKIPSN